MFGLLNAIAWDWSSFFSNFKADVGSEYEGSFGVLDTVFNVLSIVLWVILGIVGAVGAIYAIWLGIKLAKAEDQGKRDEAKKHLIAVAIAVGVTVVLILFFNTFLPAILSAFGLNEPQGLETPTTPSDKT